MQDGWLANCKKKEVSLCLMKQSVFVRKTTFLMWLMQQSVWSGNLFAVLYDNQVFFSTIIRLSFWILCWPTFGGHSSCLIMNLMFTHRIYCNSLHCPQPPQVLSLQWESCRCLGNLHLIPEGKFRLTNPLHMAVCCSSF